MSLINEYIWCRTLGSLNISEQMYLSTCMFTLTTKVTWLHVTKVFYLSQKYDIFRNWCIDVLSTSCEICLWVLQKTIDHKSTLVQVMAWYCQATSYYSLSTWTKGDPDLCCHMASLCLNELKYVIDAALVQDRLWLGTIRKLAINFSNAEDRIFRLWGSIQCLLIPWLLKPPEHLQAQYWLCRTPNFNCCFRVNFIYLGQFEYEDNTACPDEKLRILES